MKINPKRLTELWNEIIFPPEGWDGSLHFHTDKGHHIRYGFAPAELSEENHEPRGAVIITHGYGEDIDMYYETIKRYQKMGYDVYGMDWHAQGASGRANPKNPKQPSVEGMYRHVEDLDIFARKIVRPRNGDKPLIMSTNSMGGHVGMLYLQKHPDVFDGAVMSAPMFDLKTLGLPKKYFKPVMRALFNTASKVGFKHKKIAKSWEALEKTEKKNSNNEDALDKPVNARKEIMHLLGRMNEDERVDVPTFGWIASTFKTSDLLMKDEFLKQIQIPILIGSAEDESFVDNEAHEHAVSVMPDGRHIVLPDADHTLWHELGDNFDQWWDEVENLLQDVEKNVSERREYKRRPWSYDFPDDHNPADDYHLLP